MGRTTFEPALGADRWPCTVETFCAMGAVDKLGLIVLPLLVGAGMRLTSSASSAAVLTLESERALRRAPWRSATPSSPEGAGFDAESGAGRAAA